MSVRVNILDIAAINAWVLYKKATRKRISRRKKFFFLVEKLTNTKEKMAPILSPLEAN